MSRDEILDRNAEFLGSYLFNYLQPQPNPNYKIETGKKIDKSMYKRATELLYEYGHIDEAKYFSLMELLEGRFIPKSIDEAESKVRELLFPDVK